MGLFGEMLDEGKKRRQSLKELEQWKELHNKEQQRIENDYSKWVQSRQKMFAENAIKVKISNIFKEASKTGEGIGFIGFDLTKFNKLSTEERKSKYMQDYIINLKNTAYKGATKAYFEYGYPLEFMMMWIEPLSYFEEIREEIEESVRHLQYFSNSGADVRSVLTGYDNVFDGMDEIYHSEIALKENLTEFAALYDDAKKMYDQGQYVAAFNMAARTFYDVELFDDSKRLLITSAVMALQKKDDKEIMKMYEEIRHEVNDNLFRPMEIYRNAEEQLCNKKLCIVDAIIADAALYNRSGSVDNVDEELSNLLESGKDILDQSQYEVLRQAFELLKAYKQESMVLEAMVKNDIARTEQQENRLAFLKENLRNLMQNSTSAIQCIDYIKEEGKFVYDYRSVTWNDSQIISYFNMLSGENRTADTNLVISEWNNNLQVKDGIKWTIEEMSKKIALCIEKNYGDNYSCEIMDASSLSGDRMEYDKAIVIMEKDDNGRYPWVAFVIIAEQMTMLQISLSIYSVYLAQRDMVNEEDIYVKNSQMLEKFKTVKGKQNPKLNNYISTMENILIKEIENYLNENISVESIY